MKGLLILLGWLVIVAIIWHGLTPVSRTLENRDCGGYNLLTQEHGCGPWVSQTVIVPGWLAQMLNPSWTVIEK